MQPRNRIGRNRIVGTRGTGARLIDSWGCNDTRVIGNALVKAGSESNMTLISESVIFRTVERHGRTAGGRESP